MPAKIQIKKRDGGFQFVVVGQNGRTIATSEPYASKASCVNGIKALQRAATSAQVEDQTSREWLARQAAPTPPAKAAKPAAKATKAAAKPARAVGKAVGKAKAKAQKTIPPAPAPAPRKRPAKKRS